MNSRNQHLITAMFGISDYVLSVICFVVANFIRFYILNGSQLNIYSKGLPLVGIALAYSLVIVILLSLGKVYKFDETYYIGRQFISLIFADIFASSILFSAFYITHHVHVSRGVILINLIANIVVLTVKRFVICRIRKNRHERGLDLKHVILIGGAKLASRYVKETSKKSYLGISIDGYVASKQNDNMNVEYLGDFNDLESILMNADIHEAIVAIEAYEMARLDHIFEICGKCGIKFSIIPVFNDYLPHHPTVNHIGRCKVISVRETPFDYLGNAFIKRLFDIVGSLILIILSSPVLLFCAIGVKLSSPGPVIFSQERVGINKKPFKMYKFRSMRLNNDSKTAWSTDNDPRKTRFGSFIRKFSLDELPQFFNVLKGDMSLVGPRPEVPFHVQHFKEEVPLYLVRQQVRPGCTGWAQIHGLRGDTSIEARIEYDIWYIENWSLRLDLKILFITVFGGKMMNHEKIV